MANQILVPSLGESVTEATVSKWLKQVGEKVDTDEPLVELETDKVNVEVPSPLKGTLSSIKVKEGTTVEVGALLGIINEGRHSEKEVTKHKEANLEKKIYAPPKKTKKIEKTEIKKEKKLILKDIDEENSNGTLLLDTLAEKDSEKIKKEKYIPPKSKKNLSPAVRKIVEENDIDISDIQGTGKDGRISKGDLINLMGNIPGPSKRKISQD